MMKPNDKDQKCKGGIAPLWLQPLLWATAAVHLLLTCLLCFSGSRQIKHKKTEKNLSAHRYEEKKKKPGAPHSLSNNFHQSIILRTAKKKKREREKRKLFFFHSVISPSPAREGLLVFVHWVSCVSPCMPSNVLRHPTP